MHTMIATPKGFIIVVSLEVQEHDPDSNRVIVIFRDVIELESHTVYRKNQRQVIIQKI